MLVYNEVRHTHVAAAAAADSAAADCSVTRGCTNGTIVILLAFRGWQGVTTG